MCLYIFSEISDSLTETICQKCGCLIIPSLNGKIRLNHSSKKYVKQKKILSTPLSDEYIYICMCIFRYYNELQIKSVDKQKCKENYKNHLVYFVIIIY